ncbi:MAG TPA: transporter substrate-binding domain-containing protein [Roseiarcus sp.]|nr:transporter substrate-binding domain-containing protein [Roseiarcus sp.]
MRRFSAMLAAVSLFILSGGASRARDGEALRVCLNEQAPPYSVRHNGEGAGFDLAVAEALAKQLGRPLEVQWFETRLEDDVSGTLDANALLSDGRCQLLAGYPLTEDGLGKPGAESARLPDFDGLKPADRRRRIVLGTLQPSKPYHYAALTIVLGRDAPDKPVNGIGDIDGLRIGVEGGTLSDTILMTFGEGRLIDHIAHFVPGRDDFWSSFERGDFDAALIPVHQFDAYRANYPDTKLRATGYVYPVGFNIGFVRLAGDSRLMSEVDAALASLLARGEIAGLAASAGMTYLPPRQPAVRKHFLLSDLKGP